VLDGFNLPKTITQEASTITFGYDGDQARIRKTTPAQEILYFGDLYEQVTEMGSAETAHRYYVHSPERAVAVVTRGGPEAGTRYLHVDHLGSIHVVTNEKGTVDEWRSYDPFGQRRNPIWGQPPPQSFSSKTTKGFTGHESDEELSLVNMKGRLLDPKLGRFTTTDPVVSNVWHGQTFNAYAYVTNNPLSFVDPSGFQAEPPPILPIREFQFVDADGALNVVLIYPPREGATPREEGAQEATELGVAVPPTDVDTTGSSPDDALDGSATATDADWRQNGHAQTQGGFLGGLALGYVPYASMGRHALEEARVMDPGT
jgi:RHS repeat-associated protein